MTDALRHCGPDGEGFWQDSSQGLVLGHRRLAIVDLGTEGAQPMQSVSGRFVITFNGEIYNYPELRAKLESKRADMLDNCDLRRISNPTQRDFDRVAKYRRALDLLDCH